MSRALILGWGGSNTQYIFTKEGKGPNFQDNFDEVVTVDVEHELYPDRCFDLAGWPPDLLEPVFDEIHAYEVLHLVGGSGHLDFFLLWRNMWSSLKPGGFVCATTPWWQSKWAWSDPATVRVYSEECLKHLDHSNDKDLHRTNYLYCWPEEFNFKLRMARQTNPDPLVSGFAFVLEKAERDEPRETNTST